MKDDFDLISEARELAANAHAGQVDKLGDAYIQHPARVAANVIELYPEAPNSAVAVAWLHDVVEDTDVTLDRLRSLGFPDDVVSGVDAMTKRQGEAPEAYFARVGANLLAQMVKAADLKDNTDPQRVARLDVMTAERLRVKYEQSYRLLRESSV